jgi:hypothetical protein
MNKAVIPVFLLLLLSVVVAAMPVTDVVSGPFPNNFAGAYWTGDRIVINNDGLSVVGIGEDLGCTASQAILYDASWAVIGTAPFINHEATMAVPVSLGGIYYVTGVDPGHGISVFSYNPGVSFPVAQPTANFTAGFYCDPTTSCSAFTTHPTSYAACVINVTTDVASDNDSFVLTFSPISLFDNESVTANFTYMNGDHLENLSWLVNGSTVVSYVNQNDTDTGHLYVLDKSFYAADDLVTFTASGDADDNGFNATLIVHATPQPVIPSPPSFFGAAVDGASFMILLWIVLLVIALLLIKKFPLSCLFFGVYSIIFAFVIARSYSWPTGFIIWLFLAGIGVLIGVIGLAAAT